MRASDDDRNRAAALLREHHAVGRLTPEEFSERLDKVFEAKTMGELDDLLADLPGIDLYRLPDASIRRCGQPPGSTSYLSAMAAAGGPATSHGRLSSGWRAAWGSWLSCSLLLFVIWAISGAGNPWPLWVVGPWGAIMLGRWLSGGPTRPGLPPGRTHRDHGRIGRGDRDEDDGSGHDQVGGGSAGS
jgi:hypothetical protein